jgi:hypothetical protein
MKKIKVPPIIAILFFLGSCTSTDTEALAADVKLNIIDYLRSDGDFNTEVKSLTLTKVSENKYNGILTTNEYGSLYAYEVVVTTNGDIFSWQILDKTTSSERVEEMTYEEAVEDYYEEDAEMDWEEDYTSSSVSESQSYCNLSANSFFEFLTSNNFTLNGNGSVRFSRRYDFARDHYVEGDITISGSGTSLKGKYEVMNGSMIYISDLSVVSGYFDASNNEGSSGAASVDCNGNLSGTLSQGYNATELRILLK